ncbi:MAG: M14 family metallopeptidase [Bacteroidota bacterium]
MNRFLLLFFFGIPAVLSSQNLKSPTAFLGYELGEQFSRHHQVVDYFEYVANSEKTRVKLVEYGQTNERRPLLLAFVSSVENLTNFETIREEHLKSLQGQGSSDKAIVWLSYNVHGNESVCTEAAMETLYALLTTKASLLENTIVIIDPSLNPDGRDRYVNWYNQYKNTPFQVDPSSKEHHEGWLSGRSNHYMFDLNRDWAWLTQVESQQRIKVYNRWLPHVHVDFHEQGLNNPYYFAPAAEPYHEVITDFQRTFQGTIGKNHAKYFDANGWFYFTKEVFDLFYPSYGDTYPTYNGAVGMTYEQGGSGRAGLGVITKIGDTLTLKERIAHHFTTGISTVEVASQNVQKLNEEFKKFYQNKNYTYKSYVLNGDKDKIDALTELLKKHQITYGFGKPGTVKGYQYSSGKNGSLTTGEHTLVVSTDQPKGTLVKVLFEPSAKLTDSLTYDITAWSLPYAYGLDAVATTSLVESKENAPSTAVGNFSSSAYAYLTNWNSMKDARFLAELLKSGIRVRKSDAPFVIDNRSYDRGTLIITAGDNQEMNNFRTELAQIAEKHNKEITGVATGLVDEGKDFGSAYIQMIKAPKVAVLAGGPTSTLRFGEIWHFFEQQLYYPLTVIDADYVDTIDLSQYSVLILPGGRYSRYFNEERLEKIKEWVGKGGKLIALGGAISGIAKEDGFELKIEESQKDTSKTQPMPHQNLQRESMKNAITGAIFRAQVDNTHPLAYGYGSTYFTLKLGSSAYSYLDRGNAVYLSNNTGPVSGFAGSNAKKKIENSLVFGSDNYRRGKVIYMVDNPLFRGFWENGKLFFANALFMVD